MELESWSGKKHWEEHKLTEFVQFAPHMITVFWLWEAVSQAMEMFPTITVKVMYGFVSWTIWEIFSGTKTTGDQTTTMPFLSHVQPTTDLSWQDELILPIKMYREIMVIPMGGF